MANASVEKLKKFGIRHGEKIGVAIVSALTVAMFYFAFTRPTIEMTPDQVAKAADQARGNLSKEQPADMVLDKVTEAGITLPGFEEIVDSRKPGNADATPYQLTNLMAAPEPGAGLLRTDPQLIALNELFVHSGRGAISVLVVDPVTGEVVMEEPKKDEPEKKKSRRSRRSSRMSGMYGGAGSGGPGSGGMPGAGGQQKSEEEQKKDREQRQREANRLLAGGRRPPREETKEESAPANNTGLVEKVEVKGYRFTTITGVLDHKQMREQLAKALKIDIAGAHPDYKRLDIERQELQADGTWTDWQPVDREWIRNNVLNRLAYPDPETSPTTGVAMVPEDAQLESLVDPLPYLEVGYWIGVHPSELVPEEAIKPPPEEVAKGGDMMGMRGMMMSGGGNPAGSGGMGMGGPGRGYGRMMSGGSGGMMSGGSGGSGGMMPGSMGGSGGMSMFGSMFGAGGAMGGMTGDYPKTEEDRIMVRAIDFTVEPDTTYRYRVRLVIGNPNFEVESVEAGVNTSDKELFGPWSDATEPVTVPADVATYVVDYAPTSMNQQRNDVVQFAVVSWDPKTGVTIAKNNMYTAPGEVVGSPTSTLVPDLEAQRQKPATVDLTSRRVLVDSGGGVRPIDQLQVGLPQFDAPAQALELRADGILVYRDEAGDATNGEMQELMEIYRKTLEDVEEDKERESSVMDMMGGMMGAMGGMRGR